MKNSILFQSSTFFRTLACGTVIFIITTLNLNTKSVQASVPPSTVIDCERATLIVNNMSVVTFPGSAGFVRCIDAVDKLIDVINVNPHQSLPMSIYELLKSLPTSVEKYEPTPAQNPPEDPRIGSTSSLI